MCNTTGVATVSARGKIGTVRHTGSRNGEAATPRDPAGAVEDPELGLLSSTRLKTLKNSARICRDILSRRRKVRPMLSDSVGRRAYR